MAKSTSTAKKNKAKKTNKKNKKGAKMAKEKEGKKLQEMFNELDEKITDDMIEDFETTSSLSGAHKIKIVNAVVGVTDSGSKWVDFTVNIEGRTNDEGEPTEYNIDRMYLTSGTAKGGNPTPWGKIVKAGLKILKAKMRLAMKPAVVWDSDDQAFVEKKVSQFVDLLNKEVGAIIEFKQEYKRQPYDAQEGAFIGYEEYDGDNPYHIWMYNPETDAQPHFHLRHFFDLETKKTWTELNNDKSAKTVKKEHARLKERDPAPREYDNEQMYKYIEGAVKKRCKALKTEFDESVIAPYNGTKMTPLDDIAF